MKKAWLLAGFGAWLATTAAAQSSAPEIPFDSVPNFIKLPPDIYLGEAASIAVNSKQHIFVLSRGNSTGPAYGAAAAQLLEFDPNGNFRREIGHNLYAWSFAHSVRIDRHDNIWVADKGSDVVVRFDPQGRVSMVFGRKSEAAAAADRRHVPPGDRRDLGCRRQHLHQRRIHQLAHCQI
jgi:streptogramin lyase